MNVSMNPNYIEDLNGSDYVCMTRSTPQAASKLISLSPMPISSTSNQCTSSANTTSTPTAMQLTSKNLQTLQQEQLGANNRSQLNPNESEKATSTSPTPSQLSNNSNKRKCYLNGKE